MHRRTHADGNRAAAIGFLILVALTASTTAAHGNHGHGSPAPKRALGVSSDGNSGSSNMTVETSTTAFSEGVLDGTYWTLAPGGELWWHNIGISVRVPIHSLTMTGTPTETGLGDISVGAARGWRVLRGERSLVLNVGVDVLIATGDADIGLGHGATALATRLGALVTLRPRLQLNGAVSAVVNTTATPKATSFVEQRSDAEIRVEAGAHWLSHGARLGVVSQFTVPFAPSSARGTVFAVAGPSLVFGIGQRLVLSAFAMVPLGNQRQFDWTAGVALGFNPGGNKSRRTLSTDHTDHTDHTDPAGSKHRQTPKSPSPDQ